MKPTDLIRAVFYPITSMAVVLPLLVFWLLVSFASWGGVLGLFLMFLVIPALLRFQMIVLEARARGAEPTTPDIDFFSWFGNAWTLFPVVLCALTTWAVIATGAKFGAEWAIVVSVFAGLFLPASLSILAITRSPLQSLNPVALFRLIGRCGHALLIASGYLELVGWLAYLSDSLPMLLANLVQIFLVFSFFSVTGSLIEPYDLFGEVDIPEPLEKTAVEVSSGIEKERVAALSHAYGFISRDNRESGFRHIFAEIERDPDPLRAWQWYFERMLTWDEKQHSLFFAQHCVRDMLANDETIPALKMIMRCRLLNEQFTPFREDIPAAIVAAERCGNIELAAVLKRC